MKNVISFTLLLVGLLFITSIVAFSQNFWQQHGSLNGAINELAIDSHGVLYAATNGKGLFRSTDEGTSWTRINSDNMKNYYYSVYVDKNDNIFAGSYQGNAYRSTDGGSTWTTMSIGGDTVLVTSFAVDKHNKIFAGTSGGLFTSTDAGVKWDTVFAPDFPNRPIFKYITSIIIDSRQNIFVGTYGGGLYRSRDGGENWTKDGAEYWRVNTLAASINDRLFVGTDIGFYYDSLQVVTVRDTNGNIIRTDTVRSGWKESGSHIDNIRDRQVITPTLDTVILHPLHVDTLKLDTTIVHDTTIYHDQYYALSLAATQGGHLYAGTYGQGVYRSLDNGASWKQMTTGITDSVVTAVLINPNTGYLYAGTMTGAFFRSANPDTTHAPPQINRPVPIPALVTLEQNYPNPFNPMTTIPFTIYQNSYATLIIYDVLGKEVVRLIDGVITAGKHEVQWDASSVSSGVYFYRLQTNSIVKTGKLTLLR